MGHLGGPEGHIILKSDGEASIVAVREALARYPGGRVVPEDVPRGESQSNGTVEEAGKTVREYARVLKAQLEEKTGMTLHPGDSITAWMVRWAAMLYSRYAVGKDGLTPYERRRGRKCRVPAVCFGEKVWFKLLRVEKDRKDKFESDMREGVWLGHTRSSNEHVVGTKFGICKAYTIKRQDSKSRWCSEAIRSLRGTPHQPDPDRPGLAIPVRVGFDPVEVDPAVLPPPAPEPYRRQIRRMQITGDLLSKYGYTPGCEGCRYKQAGLAESRNHSEKCRARIEEAMSEDPIGRQRKDEDDERICRRMAEQFEAENPAEGEPVQGSTAEGSEAPNMQAGGSHLRAPDAGSVENEAGMNQDAGLSPGSPGSGVNPGPKEGGEPSPKGPAGDNPTGTANGPRTFGPSGPGHKSRSRSPMAPAKREGALSPRAVRPRALSPSSRPGVSSGSGEPHPTGSASGEQRPAGPAKRSPLQEL